MTPVNYWKRYVGDYLRDTGHLSLAEHGAYTLLLDHYYSTQRPLPEAMESLNRLCRAIGQVEQKAVAAIAEQFFPIGEDGLRHNHRADEELTKWGAQAETNRLIAEERERKRKEHEQSTNRVTDGATTGQPIPEARSQKPEVKSQKPEKAEGSATSPPKVNGHARPLRGTRLPADWIPGPEGVRFCKDERPDLNPDDVLEAFRDHWASVAGQRGLKLDWQATWRNWIRKEPRRVQR